MEMDINKLMTRIGDCAMNVRKQLGAGFLEAVYKNAMIIELRKAGISHEVEKPLKVYYDGFVVGEYRADIIVENCLILELKAIQNLTPANEVQLVNYLTATGIDHGMLINFGGNKIEFRHKYRVYRKKPI